MGLSERNLVPSKKKGTYHQRIFLGMSRLVTCHIQNWELNHKAGSAYMQQNTSNIFQQGSLYWCWDITSMLPQTHDITTISKMRCYTSRYPTSQDKLKFDYPKTPPYPLISENIQNLKQWLLDQFATTMFNKSGKFPPAHIHLKDGAIPQSQT